MTFDRFDGLEAQQDYSRLDLLSELSRTTTVYHEASVDRVEDAREEYFRALKAFNAAQEPGCIRCREDGPGFGKSPTG